ncbi:MAG: hypothetical protein A3F73_01975 [Gallionellales bacterium RIFCSPLOWO2_12_FULL_59_22]|nr:MAG: hypothetical protein A3H99_04810 [Gallionellales bacterium RIFCSPLOWO2_02_FULL_59_110]OGT04905.1 MAG: hypothetical protein A2Z65_06725 [Gallionellales bacterium RIFCSPLOWO2_02_58_13]OGT13888.1 MAG: hypothetical protein A3F73_01975 [Gallionellales bacterium RIFCSPLOWO2_12_FULL_59_22]
MNISPATIAIDIARFKSQSLNSLVESTSDFKSTFASAVSLSSLEPGSAITNPMAAGRNMSLPDPESAYKMMTTINNQDALYKAQFSELSQMKNSVEQMEDAGRSLGGITADTGNDSIKSRLQDFAGQYNAWIQRFAPTTQHGGLLAGTQAAQISIYELEQSVKNVFNGIHDGLRGLGDLGISIGSSTKLMSLDGAKLDAVLAANKRGVVNTVREFSANFAKAADLLNADNNFIPNQLNNLDRVIDYISDNKVSLQKEFGTGDAARPTGQVAKALSAYNLVSGL